MSEQEHFIIQKIVAKRFNVAKKRTEYRIKWLGYPASQSTWEPKSNLAYSIDLVKLFDEEEKKRTRELRTLPKQGLRGKRITKANRTSNHNGGNLIKEEDSQSDESQRVEDSLAPEELANNSDQEEDPVHDEQIALDANIVQMQVHEAPDQEYDSNPLSFSTFSDLNQKIEILCLSKHNESLYFKVRWGEEVKWISHDLMLSKYLKELIEFYEQFITLD